METASKKLPSGISCLPGSCQPNAFLLYSNPYMTGNFFIFLKQTILSGRIALMKGVE